MNSPNPSKRDYKPFLIVAMPLLLLLCIVGIACVVIFAVNAWYAAFILPIASSVSHKINLTMIWVSTPTEQKIIAENIEQPTAWAKLCGIIANWRTKA